MTGISKTIHHSGWLLAIGNVSSGCGMSAAFNTEVVFGPGVATGSDAQALIIIAVAAGSVGFGIGIRELVHPVLAGNRALQVGVISFFASDLSSAVIGCSTSLTAVTVNCVSIGRSSDSNGDSQGKNNAQAKNDSNNFFHNGILSFNKSFFYRIKVIVGFRVHWSFINQSVMGVHHLLPVALAPRRVSFALFALTTALMLLVAWFGLLELV